ncbi:type II CAAX endopeptidase family protein, partial [Zunongwangia sp. F363]
PAIMKDKFPMKYTVILFLGYIAYLLLEHPINSFIETFSLPILYQGYLSNLILLFPLLILLIFLLFRLNLEKSLKSKDKRIYLIPIGYLFFVIIMSFSAFKNAISLELLIFLFSLSLVGFTEEILFRGIIFPKLSDYFSSIWLGALFSSFLFGIGHYINLFKNPDSINEITYQVISAFCIGVLMCGIFYKTKNIFIPSLIHTIFNLQSLIRVFNGIRNQKTTISDTSKEVFHPSIWELLNQELLFNLSCFLIGLALIFFANKNKENSIITAGNNG